MRTYSPNRVIFTDCMAIIDLERRKAPAQFCVVDLADYPKVQTHRWHLKHERGSNYAETWITPTKRLKIHQLLTGENGFDHADGDGLNNVRLNLRPATQRQNNQNQRRRKDSRHAFKGIALHSGRYWRARISAPGKKIHLGYFNSPAEAAAAYDRAAIQYFGKFARLNFPEVNHATE